MKKHTTIDGVDLYLVPDNEWLLISRDGIPYSSRRHKKYFMEEDKDGYFTVTTRVDNDKVKLMLHRAVALTFIPNPDNKPQVNHIDSDRKNNCIDNLEWVTPFENTVHGYSSRPNSQGGKGLSSLSKEDFIKSIHLYGEGYSYKEITEFFGLSIRPDSWIDVFSGRRYSSITGITKDIRVSRKEYHRRIKERQECLK